MLVCWVGLYTVTSFGLANCSLRHLRDPRDYHFRTVGGLSLATRMKFTAQVHSNVMFFVYDANRLPCVSNGQKVFIVDFLDYNLERLEAENRDTIGSRKELEEFLFVIFF